MRVLKTLIDVSVMPEKVRKSVKEETIESLKVVLGPLKGDDDFAKARGYVITHNTLRSTIFCRTLVHLHDQQGFVLL